MWHQNCYVTRTMYETVNGVAPDEITAQKNQDYLYNVDLGVQFTVYSGYRIYKQRGKDKAVQADDRDPFKFTLKKLGLTSSPAEAITYQERKEEADDHNAGESENHLSAEQRCEILARDAPLPFKTLSKSNGAPAGCVRYNGDGRVVFVSTCNNHPNCNTMDCNGCVVLELLEETLEENINHNALEE